MAQENSSPPGFRSVPRTGVIYVVTEARKHGFSASDPQWVNFGQGAPEIGELDGGAERIRNIPVADTDYEYAPVDGLMELREAVAELYNQRYRQDSKSKYTFENVCICSGGRLGLTRLVSTLGRSNIGHFLPDYTAYEELLDSFGTFVPIPVLLRASANYEFPVEKLRAEILGRGLSAVLLSNPCNPTGKLIQGQQLKDWVKTSIELSTTLILDEFYSHYVYGEQSNYVSAAKYVEDVNKDPVVILDGLTKNWRYPGWRVCWTVGPKAIIEGLASAGSFLDGGCAHPIQRAAVSLLRPEVANQEAAAIKREFSIKREIMITGLRKIGVEIHCEPGGGFYCWGDISKLPESLNSGTKLFRAALEKKVIIVPGEFFDINPGQRRPDRPSRFKNYARFSFGPEKSALELGLAKLEELVAEHRK